MAVFFLVASLPPVRQILEEPLTAGTAYCVWKVLLISGENVVRSGGSVFSPAFSIIVDWRCTALPYALALLAGFLACPASWQRRALGLGAGLAALGLLNVLRIVTIFLAGAYCPRSVPILHSVLWEVLMLAGTCTIYLAWMRWNRNHGE